jgi:hypothetical protein
MLPAHIAPRDWEGHSVALVASGPSAQSLDPSTLDVDHVVAVAHGYKVVPDAEVLVVGGIAFYQTNNLADFRGKLVIASGPKTDSMRHNDSRVVRMVRAGPEGISTNPRELCGSESSVMLAINYVVHRGVSRIELYGCDGKPSDKGIRRVGSDKKDTPDAIARYQLQERAMATQIVPLQKLGVTIVNKTPGTALRIYPRG